MLGRILLGVLPLLAFAARGTDAAAQEPKAGADAVTPAAVAGPAKVDSPKAAIAELFRGIATGDPKLVARRVHAAGERHAELSLALQDAASAVAEVRKAAAAKFGPAAERGLDFDLAPPAAVEKSEQAIDGDTAEINFVLEPGVIEIKLPFERRDGLWKVSVAKWAADEEAAIDVRGMAASARGSARNVSKLAPRVTAGEFKSVEALRRTLENTLLPRAATVEMGPDGEIRPVPPGEAGEDVDGDATETPRRPADAPPSAPEPRKPR